MEYIKRTISVIQEGKTISEMLDSDFLSLNAPLILLGEPGAGKSEIVKQFCSFNANSKYYTATAVTAYSTIPEIDSVGKIVIDGIDEVSAYAGKNSIIDKILSKITHIQNPHFILTCRAADWQVHTTTIIKDIYKVAPIIGHIVPFSEKEVSDFVNSHGVNGEKFISEVHKHGIFDLIKNPNTLLLFIKSYANNQFPNNKSELFKDACKNLLQEIREPHKDQKSHISYEDLFDAAGFICTQLLLANKEGISISESLPCAPNISEIINSTSTNYEAIRHTLSTRIFRPNPNNVLVPCHRTVAEYLSARWLSKALSQQLSLKRLQTLLYSNNLTVPSALRGLHAWLVTVNPKAKRDLTRNDPYGLLKYGDCSNFNSNEKIALLEAIKEIAIKDPYFRGSDYYLGIGKELISTELKDEIFKILKNNKSPIQLNDMLMEALSHDKNPEFINASHSDLLSIIFNNKLRNRRIAINLLLSSESTIDWIAISNKLFRKRDIDSKKLILQIIEHKPHLFNHNFISKLFITFTGEATIGLGYLTISQLSIEQIEGCLNDFLAFMRINKSQRKNDKSRSCHRIKELMQNFIIEYFKKADVPSISLIWSCIRYFKNLNSTEKPRALESPLLENEKFRRLIQKEALATTTLDSSRMIFHSFAWLWINEEDLIHHLEHILISNISHKESIWNSLVSWIFANPWFTGKALNFALAQSKLNKKLEIIFNGISVHKQEIQKTQIDRQTEMESKGIKSIEIRHSSYAEVSSSIQSGENIQALNNIAKAYLGLFYKIKGDTPKCRIKNLIGDKLIKIALEGIYAAIEGSHIPSANEIIQSDANRTDNKFKYLLICYVDLSLSRGVSLDLIPKNILSSALASFHWGDGFSLKLYTHELMKQLEQYLLDAPSVKEQFLIETIEPYLISNSKLIPGLYRIRTEQHYFDILGKLAIEWFKKYPSLNEQILIVLLEIAVCYGDHEQLIPIIREKVATFEVISNSKLIWIGVSFLLDFDFFNETITVLKEHIWTINAWMWGEQKLKKYWPTPKANQLFYFISKFAPLWSPTLTPIHTRIDGNENPWDASKCIVIAINQLSSTYTKEANILLLKTINNLDLVQYFDVLNHAYIENNRFNKEPYSLKDVRHILLNTKPQSHEDLQALILDMLENLQIKISSGQTSDYRTYWKHIDLSTSDKPLYIPHEENDCRNLIASPLELLFDNYEINIHPEGFRSSDKRCDLLVISENIAIPVELKGQWHSDVYKAAFTQLQEYTKEPRAKGFGVYIVLWFGDCTKKPASYRGKKPSTIEEMKSMLQECYKDLPLETKWFVIDLSKRDQIKKRKK